MKGYARNDNFTVLIRRLLTCLMRPDFRITIPLETIPTSFTEQCAELISPGVPVTKLLTGR